MQLHTNWLPGPEAWKQFVDNHPELGYRTGRWSFHNFLRHFRGQLRHADAIRMARGRFWIAQQPKFEEVAFNCATGVVPKGDQ